MPRALIPDDYQRVALTLADRGRVPDDRDVVALADHLAAVEDIVAFVAGAPTRTLPPGTG